MNILYHSRDFIVQYGPPDAPLARDENTVQADLEGERNIRALVTSATQRVVEAGRAATAEEEFGSSMLVRAEAIGANRTQLFALPSEAISEIYALSDEVEYVCPYQAAIRAYVNHRFRETQAKLSENAAVAVADVQGSNAFITVIDEDVIDIFRAVPTEEIITEFHRTVDYYAHAHPNRDLFLMVNRQELAGELLSGGALLGPDVIPEPCPSLWALHALEVTPRFILPELEAKKEQKRERRKSLLRLSVTGTAAVFAGLAAFSIYFSHERNGALIGHEEQAISRLKEDLSTEAKKKFPSLVKSLQPIWTDVIMEIAVSLPEGTKIRKMTITDTQIGMNTGTRAKHYAVNIRAALDDPNPLEVSRAQTQVNEKLTQTKYLRKLSTQVTVEMEGSVSLLLTGTIDVGEDNA